MKPKLLLLLSVAVLLFASCNTNKEIPYMIGANQLPQEVLQSAAKASDPVVMPGDMLQINVISSNTEAVKPFNKIDYVSNLGGNGNLNSNNEKRTVRMPKSTYTIVGDGDVINEKGLYTITTNEIIVPSRSAIIMHD